MGATLADTTVGVMGSGEVAHELLAVVALFLSGGPLLAVIIWLQKDARRARFTAGTRMKNSLNTPVPTFIHRCESPTK